MKFLLLSIGTRGDAEPFLAIGDLLHRSGHEVTIALPAQFRPLAEDAGLDFAPLDERFLEILDGQTARDFMGQKGSWPNRLFQLARLARTSLSVQKDMIREQRDLLVHFAPDRVVFHPKCLVARVWGMQFPERAICLSPVPNILHPVRSYPHIGITTPLGKWANWKSFTVVNRITARMVAKYVKPYAADFPGTDVSSNTIYHHMLERERTLYLISPTLYPRPEHWPGHAKVMGYFERNKTRNWSPPAELTDYLARYKAEQITFITFGSMVNAAPEATTQAILSVLRKYRVPAIINTSSGGLQRLEREAPDHVLFVSDIPYEWVFPKVHSVVHHGGSGTLHTATKHGRPSLIIPHIVDQFFWNRQVASLGLGPLGVKVKQLTAKSFSPLLLDLRTTVSYAETARKLSARMAHEADPKELLAELTK
ncbi:glycosyltransferase family 1 protein [Neolewinella aurantiaca]|uniref:Glycosyltransferase family 1 protein n=1 Tax=Neolewinella aurantiaca TaxID=2602767 RepID=A0A5C7FPN7_9BACT|nr:glycosyltransferase [Neolewinella aurantiaca]TXF89688.1 glycosyltransferase family 1 protein [Neolewinella aurantiaca]